MPTKSILTYRGLHNWLKAQPPRRVIAKNRWKGDGDWPENCPAAMYVRHKTGVKNVSVTYYSYRVAGKIYAAPEWLENFLWGIDRLRLKQLTVGRCLKVLDTIEPGN